MARFRCGLCQNLFEVPDGTEGAAQCPWCDEVVELVWGAPAASPAEDPATLLTAGGAIAILASALEGA